MNYILLNPKCYPSRTTVYEAGWDLRASRDTIVYAQESAIVPLGIKIEIPEGYYGLLTHRSSLAFNNNAIISLGIIDASFRNEIKACVFNLHDHKSLKIQEGQRIAQIVIQEINNHIKLNEVKEFKSNGLKEGFGSSGSM